MIQTGPCGPTRRPNNKKQKQNWALRFVETRWNLHHQASSLRLPRQCPGNRSRISEWPFFPADVEPSLKHSSRFCTSHFTLQAPSNNTYNQQCIQLPSRPRFIKRSLRTTLTFAATRSWYQTVPRMNERRVETEIGRRRDQGFIST